MVLPLVKLGALAVKTFSKPIAYRLKKQAGLHPKFRQFIIDLAQANHRLTTNIQRRIYGHATDVEIRPLNEEKAIQAASDLIGEVFIFSSSWSVEFKNFSEAIPNPRFWTIKWISYLVYLCLSCLPELEIALFMLYLTQLSWRQCTLLITTKVAGAAVIIEVQRSASKEAKKEELRRQEMEDISQREGDLANELKLLKLKIVELEKLAEGRGLSGVFHFRHAQSEAEQPAKAS